MHQMWFFCNSRAQIGEQDDACNQCSILLSLQMEGPNAAKQWNRTQVASSGWNDSSLVHSLIRLRCCKSNFKTNEYTYLACSVPNGIAVSFLAVWFWSELSEGLLSEFVSSRSLGISIPSITARAISESLICSRKKQLRTFIWWGSFEGLKEEIAKRWR